MQISLVCIFLTILSCPFQMSVFCSVTQTKLSSCFLGALASWLPLLNNNNNNNNNNNDDDDDDDNNNDNDNDI